MIDRRVSDAHAARKQADYQRQRASRRTYEPPARMSGAMLATIWAAIIIAGYFAWQFGR